MNFDMGPKAAVPTKTISKIAASRWDIERFHD